jgi:type IV pilus assembly protein PilF
MTRFGMRFTVRQTGYCQAALLLVVTLVLSACITTEGRVFTNEAAPQEALQTRVELARRYVAEGNWEDAKRNLAVANEIDPNSPDVHEAFALVYQSTGEYELAEVSFKKAIAEKRDFSRARNNYAAFLYSRKRYAEAEEQLELVVKDLLYESRPQAFVNLGLCRLQLGDNDGAREALVRALTMNRTNTIALLELAHIEYEAENWAASQRYFDVYRTILKRPSPRALWLGVRLSDKLENGNAKASYALALRNLYPDSGEFQAYEQAVQDGEL